MICPGCGSELASAGRAVEAPRVAYRERKCGACGKRWPTVERCLKPAVKIGLSNGLNHGLNHGLKIKPSAVKIDGGTERGGLDPVSSVLSSPDPEVVLAPEVTTALEASGAGAGARDPSKRGRGDAVEYPEDFERLWKETGRHGNKDPAFKVWVRIKTEATLTVLIERWLEWGQTQKWLDGFIPNLSTWLNARGWQDEPPEHEFRSKGAGAAPRGAARNVEHVGDWLDKRGGTI